MEKLSNKQVFTIGLFFGMGFVVAPAVLAAVPAIISALGAK